MTRRRKSLAAATLQPLALPRALEKKITQLAYSYFPARVLVNAFKPSTVLLLLTLVPAGCANDGSNGKSNSASSVPVVQGSTTTAESGQPKPSQESPKEELSPKETANTSVSLILKESAWAKPETPTNPSAIDNGVKNVPSAVLAKEAASSPTQMQPQSQAPPAPAPDLAQDTQTQMVPQSMATSTTSQRSGLELSVGTILCAVFLGVILVPIIRYRRSESARARRRMREIVADFEAVQTRQKELQQAAQNAVKAAARDYVSEKRRSYLRAISLDDVRKLAPGVRLQPLYACGVNNLLDCQGWTADRFLQLHGIGPDSASRIAAACSSLTTAANKRAIPHPKLSDSNASSHELYLKVFALGKVLECLRGQQENLRAALEPLRVKCSSVESRTSFPKWLFGSEIKDPIKAALDEARAIDAQASSNDHEFGRCLSEGKNALSNAKAASQQPISHSQLLEDVEANKAFYQEALKDNFGPESTGGATPGYPENRCSAATEPIAISRTAYREPVHTIPKASSRGITIEVRIGDRPLSDGYKGASEKAADCWIPANNTKSVAGYSIPGGLIYLGQKLRSVNQQTFEPALIDPSLPVDRSNANCQVRMLDYWPSYRHASSVARASYLQWLAGGRSDPAADVGYVFLFFYGLERRVLIDAVDDPAARDEIPTIVAEVLRLRAIYSKNGSFNGYSRGFLECIENSNLPDVGGAGLVEEPELVKYHLSLSLRRRLGAFAMSGQPLPAKWAYAWIHNDPRTRLTAAANRCPDELSKLFETEYGKRFGKGVVLPINKTQLKLTYKPASPSFSSPVIRMFEQPDVSVLGTPYSKIEAIAMDCCRQLDAYGRFIARNQGLEKTLEGATLLPAALWPEPARRTILELKEKAETKGTAHVTKFGDLLESFPPGEMSPRSRYAAFCGALAEIGVGIEPDVRFGGAVPSRSDPVAIFADADADSPSEGFGIAALVLQLAAVVATSDGDFVEREAEKIQEGIRSNTRIPESERRRLIARLAVYHRKAPLLSGLKKSIEPLNTETRSEVIDFLIGMVYSDGAVTPGEVKSLEKIYSLFGFDAASLYAKLHGLAAVSDGVPKSETTKVGTIQLDKAKVERLKAVSAEVTKKLTVIFNSDDTAGAEPSTGPTLEEETSNGAPPNLLGLDTAHAELLTVLLERSEWTREEFEELCADKGLMPNGAIEAINEAAFAKFDQAIIEGEDPLEIVAKIIEEEDAA